jgi:hypothetical protein
MAHVFEVRNSGEMVLNSFVADPGGFEGMLIYNTSNKCLKFYNGTLWVNI